MIKYDKIILKGGDTMKWYTNLLIFMAIFGLLFIVLALYLQSIAIFLVGAWLVMESICFWIIKR